MGFNSNAQYIFIHSHTKFSSQTVQEKTKFRSARSRTKFSTCKKNQPLVRATSTVRTEYLILENLVVCDRLNND